MLVQVSLDKALTGERTKSRSFAQKKGLGWGLSSLRALHPSVIVWRNSSLAFVSSEEFRFASYWWCQDFCLFHTLTRTSVSMATAEAWLQSENVFPLQPRRERAGPSLLSSVLWEGQESGPGSRFDGCRWRPGLKVKVRYVVVMVKVSRAKEGPHKYRKTDALSRSLSLPQASIIGTTVTTVAKAIKYNP